jgi:hypothetical protein
VHLAPNLPLSTTLLLWLSPNLHPQFDDNAFVLWYV